MSFEYVILLAFMFDVSCAGIEDTLKVPKDCMLSCKGVLAKHGYPPEIYYVTTTDGYIIEVYHIPGDKTKPLLFLHGIFDTSCGWFLRGNRSLGIMAAEEGYDVWAINFRGNRYSRNHTSLDPDKDSKFWDYSAHEYGVYDVPACIDFVLKETGQKQLSVVGFSEGTTSMFILGSTRPEYNEKVKMFVALAPMAYMENVRPALSYIIGMSPFLDFILPQSMQEVSGYYSMQKAILNMICTQLAIGYELCYQGGLNSVSGQDPIGIEREFFSCLFAHFPAGTSRKNLMHFAKISLQKSFSQYDYGATKNLQVYRSFTPPVYDLSKMTIKTVAVSGENDPVSTMKDVEKLLKVLPNVVGYKVAERKCFNHLDHVFGTDAPELVYGYVLDELRKYS